LKTPKGLVRVYSVHLQSNRLTYTATRIAPEGDLREKETWKDIRFVLARYKLGAQIRAEQAKILGEHIAQSPHPVILCGDLNDTPITYTYRILSKDLQDSFREKGAGIGSTFAGKLPTLRIDYVFAAKAFQVRDHRVPDVELSDHFPVWVRLGW
jgi:endonuclease/exonuclease/phosphatase family metal-dependent hydrolase